MEERNENEAPSRWVFFGINLFIAGAFLMVITFVGDVAGYIGRIDSGVYKEFADKSAQAYIAEHGLEFDKIYCDRSSKTGSSHGYIWCAFATIEGENQWYQCAAPTPREDLSQWTPPEKLCLEPRKQ